MRDTETMTKDGHQQPMTNTLAALRRASGRSSADVAQRMGVNEQRVRAIEARFPNLNYDTLLRYMEAIGGQIHLTVGRTRVRADQLIPDPTKAGTRDYLATAARRGGSLVYVPSAASEELPLEQGTPEPGSNDTGRDVDEGDTEGDQSNREGRQET